MLSTEKKELCSYIDQNAAFYEAIADEIWDNPELSLKEFHSAALYCDKLRELGFAVEENLCGIKTAFSGSYGSGRPIIGILGEFDALSGLSQKAGAASPDPILSGGSGHGCGHNLLGAGSLAAAAAIKNYMEKTGLPGTVIYFGCPGEEGGAGKAYMAREGLWKHLDAALCWHPGDVNQTMTGTNNSCIQVLYKFSGKAAHAAGDPYNGRSALDAVELMNVGAQFLREHTTPDCRIHYAITDAGGISPNVVQ
ncbi:MAG: amidohydrolase, partial [Oscillospiraceae bacterium]|nr:amidohydrolase [Oscillospiraceae bacterium]